MFLYLLIISLPLPFHLVKLLCLGWPFCILEVCGSFLLWRLLPVGGVGWVACQGFLVRELASVFWWVLLDFFSLECNEVSSSQFWDVYGFGVTLGSLYVEAQGYIPALLENLCSMSFSGTYWLLGGAWFQWRYGGFWIISYQLMFPGVRSSLVFSGLGLKPSASGFQSYSYTSLKTSPSIQHWR